MYQSIVQVVKLVINKRKKRNTPSSALIFDLRPRAWEERKKEILIVLNAGLLGYYYSSGDQKNRLVLTAGVGSLSSVMVLKLA